jgi:hypothetical protein
VLSLEPPKAKIIAVPDSDLFATARRVARPLPACSHGCKRRWPMFRDPRIDADMHAEIAEQGRLLANAGDPDGYHVATVAVLTERLCERRHGISRGEARQLLTWALGDAAWDRRRQQDALWPALRRAIAGGVRARQPAERILQDLERINAQAGAPYLAYWLKELFAHEVAEILKQIGVRAAWQPAKAASA